MISNICAEKKKYYIHNLQSEEYLHSKSCQENRRQQYYKSSFVSVCASQVPPKWKIRLSSGFRPNATMVYKNFEDNPKLYHRYTFLNMLRAYACTDDMFNMEYFEREKYMRYIFRDATCFIFLTKLQYKIFKILF